MPKRTPIWVYRALAIATVLAGGCGMCLSLLHMSCADLQEILAGGAIFIAGSILAGSGVVALALLALPAALAARDAESSEPDGEA